MAGMSYPSRFWADLSTRDFAEARTWGLAAQTVAVLPVAAVEQHGPHLPVGTDYLTVEHLAREAAGIAADQISVVVAPTLPFGSSHHHIPFGGTMSLSTEGYYRIVTELAESLIQGGIGRFSL